MYKSDFPNNLSYYQTMKSALAWVLGLDEEAVLEALHFFVCSNEEAIDMYMDVEGMDENFLPEELEELEEEQRKAKERNTAVRSFVKEFQSDRTRVHEAKKASGTAPPNPLDGKKFPTKSPNVTNAIISKKISSRNQIS